MARFIFVFGDIEGKLDVLRVECTKCRRKGRYSVPRLKFGEYQRPIGFFSRLSGCEGGQL
jgi:hypothetical protein